MGLYEDRILPRIVDVLMRNKEMARLRARVAAPLEGDVLEVGFGSGLNVPHYPDAVKRVRAVDPATLGRTLAAKRLAASPVPVEFVGLRGESVPVDDDSVDHVLVTWSLCTIPGVEQALAEMQRVLRPGGQLHFIEHGLSPEPKVAQWQDRITPTWRRVFGGCHLNRDIDDLVMGAGFELSQLENFSLRGPKTFGYMYEGIATKP